MPQSNQSKQKKLVLIAVISALVLGFGGLAYINSTSESEKNQDFVRSTPVTESKSASQEFTDSNNTPLYDMSTRGDQQPNVSASANPEMPNANPANSTTKVESGYTAYDPQKFSNAKYGKVVLFFHASWCPSCRGLENDIKQNLDKIPKDLLILKIDYDTNIELRRKYEVTMQHTLVSVDAEGKMLKSSRGLYQLVTIESLVDSFK